MLWHISKSRSTCDSKWLSFLLKEVNDLIYILKQKLSITFQYATWVLSRIILCLQEHKMMVKWSPKLDGFCFDAVIFEFRYIYFWNQFSKMRRPQKLTMSSPSIWHYVVSIKSTVKISSIFLAFLENTNFTRTCLAVTKVVLCSKFASCLFD